MIFMKSLFFPLILIVLLTLSCNKEEEPVLRTFDDVEEDFSVIPLSSGVQDVALELTEGVFWHFRMVPPSVLTSSLQPLVLALHGASGGDNGAHLGTECLIEPGLESINAYILSPNAGTSEWFDPENQEKLATLMFLAKKYWPVDPDRVVITGYSNGGNASWFYSEHQSNSFSAGIPLASSYHSNTSIKINTPLYVIHGEDDELFPVDSTQKWVEEYIDSGGDIQFVIADTLSHFRPCDYVPYLQGAATWLNDEVWNK